NKEIILPEGIITRKVKVNRSRTSQEALNATRREQYTKRGVVKEMPQGEGEEIEIYLIPFQRLLSVDQLEKEVDNTDFKLVDPIALAALNETDPELADKYPNGTQWRDKNGKACYAFFGRGSNNLRSVSVGRDDIAWDTYW